MITENNIQMDSLVSVVIPTFNHASFLEKALQSVLDQTYPCWEVLVVDNHSQDNTDEVVKSFNCPNIRLLKIHNHGVIAASRNLGMREAKGDWISLLDSDDFWYPGKLETLMAFVKLGDTHDVLSNDELKVDIKKNKKRITRYGPYEGDFYKALLTGGNRLSPSATMIRHDFLVKHGITFNESQNYISVEDYGFWLDLARAGARFKFIHEVLGEYIIHGANISSQFERSQKNFETLLHDHVFNIHNFHASPERLWIHISPQLHLREVRKSVEEGKLYLALKQALKTLIGSPGGTIMYLFSRLKRTLWRGVCESEPRI